MQKTFLFLTIIFLTLFSIPPGLAKATGFTISHPTENSVFQGNVVTVKFTAPTNFKFSPALTHTRPVYGRGHVHLWLDSTDLSPDSAIHVDSDTYVFENVKYGSHTLTAEWVANNDTPANPRAVSTVSFTTKPIPIVSDNLHSRRLIQTSFLMIVLAIASLYLVSRFLVLPKTKLKSASKSKSSKTNKKSKK